jgi:hypothetical protein
MHTQHLYYHPTTVLIAQAKTEDPLGREKKVGKIRYTPYVYIHVRVFAELMTEPNCCAHLLLPIFFFLST